MKVDDEVGGDSQELPEDEELQQGIGQEKAQHGEAEQVQEREVTRGFGVGRHEAQREDVDQNREKCHQQKKRHRQRVHQNAYGDRGRGERGCDGVGGERRGEHDPAIGERLEIVRLRGGGLLIGPP